MPQQADVDFGPNVTATSTLIAVEVAGLSADTSKGLVQIVARTKASCASAVGGTVTVLSPPGTGVMYFGLSSLPDGTVTSFQDVMSPRPVAIVYNIPLGSDVVVRIDHPTCKQTPFPFDYEGRTYTGKVQMNAVEPGDNNSALVVLLE
jgi:hypothetical protein